MLVISQSAPASLAPTSPRNISSGHDFRVAEQDMLFLVNDLDSEKGRALVTQDSPNEGWIGRTSMRKAVSSGSGLKKRNGF